MSKTKQGVTNVAALTQLKKWLAVPVHTKAMLAKKLGYASASAVNNWVTRKSVPSFQRARVMQLAVNPVRLRKAKNVTLKHSTKR